MTDLSAFINMLDRANIEFYESEGSRPERVALDDKSATFKHFPTIKIRVPSNVLPATVFEFNSDGKLIDTEVKV